MTENSSITTTIFSWMLNNLNLSGVEVLVFSILCSIGGTTASQLSEFTGMNERTTTYTLNKLVEKECVVKTGGITNGKRTPIYYAVKRDYEIWYEKSCEKLYEISYQREKEAKREIHKEDYPISLSIIKENEDIDSNKDDDSNNEIGSKPLNKDSSTPKEKTKTFVKPTVEEVRAYCLEKGYNVDPEDFVNFYESKNWYVGINKMVKWKSSCALWANRNKNTQQKTQSKKAESFDVDEFAAVALKRSGGR